MLRNLSATWHLFRVSLWRLVRSRQTMVSLILFSFACLAVIAWSLDGNRTAADFIEKVFLGLYATILLPIFCLSYGTAGIASDREERTLVYLLVAPLPRPWIYLAKAAASLAPALAWTLGGLAILSRLGGRPGIEAWGMLWPSVALASAAYVGLFLVYSVLFRRATLLAMAHALFLETLIGNLPGIAKRWSISFYFRSMVLDATKSLRLDLDGPLLPELFLPISGAAAQWALVAVISAVLVIGAIIFSTREYPA